MPAQSATSGLIVVSVSATVMTYNTGLPATIGVKANFPTPPIVEAKDANGNRDLGYTAITPYTITLGGTLPSYSGSDSWAAGLLTLNNFVFDGPGTGTVTISAGGITTPAVSTSIQAVISNLSQITAVAASEPNTISSLVHSSRSSQISDEMLLSLGCKLASLIAASVFEDLDEVIFKKICRRKCVVVEVKDPLTICTRGQKNVESSCDTYTKRKYQGCSAAMNILRMAQRVVSSSSSNHAGRTGSSRISCQMETTRTYIATLHSLIAMEEEGFDSSKSFRLAQRLVDLCSVEGQGHSMSMSGGRAETQESARASLLLARILQLHNRKEAQDLLGRLEISFQSSGLHQCHAEAVALFAFFSVTKSAGEGTLRVAAKQHTSQRALLLLHRTLAVARRHHYPVVESNICQYVSLITNVLT